MPKAITYIDLFSGIGGFREGLSRAGGFVCVGHCEIDKYADQSYRALFDTKGEWFREDVREADPKRNARLRPAVRGISLPIFFDCWTPWRGLPTQEVRCSLKLPG